MATNLIGYDPLPENIKWLESAIKQWTKVHRSYADAFEGGDALYWFNERPNIGALAAAAWKAGMIAIEEYATMKRPHPATKKKSGRVDLYIANDDSDDATLEGKLAWVAPKTSHKRLKDAMTAALKDARRGYDGKQKIGVVFYVMRVRVEDMNDAVLKNEIERVRKTNPHALAWCFPKVNRSLKSSKPEYEDFVWPGVIMALKVA